mgnify:CR=1 FL=1
MIVLTLLSIVPSLAAGWNLSPNFGWLLMAALTGSYMFYEIVHFSCHVDDNWLIRNTPIINTARRHHTAHHNQGIMMHYNMNLTFPVADWFMKTSDLDRGLVGTLFNGMDTSHVREELKPVIARFRLESAPVTLDGPVLTAEEDRRLASA